jgi:fibronectin type 3 domain-containing protein
MKRKLFTIAGVTALMLSFMVLAGCPNGDDGGNNTGGNNTGGGDLTGTWTGDSFTLIFTAAAWNVQVNGNTMQSGTYTLSGTSLALTSSSGTLNGTATVSGNTLTISGFTGDAAAINGTYTKQGSSGGGTGGGGTGTGGGGSGTTTVPSAPTGVTATAQSSSSISVSWNAVSGAASYAVYYEVGTSTTKSLASSGITGTSYTHSGLQASTTYDYYIKAVNDAGESGYSTSASATTQSSGGSSGGGGTTSKPSAPTGVTATATSSGIRITWTAVSGATKYRLYAAMTSYGSGLDVGNYKEEVTGTSYTDTYPEAGETWYYKVSAVNSAGEGPQSAVKSATASGGGGGAATVPSVPTGVSASRSPRSDQYVTITWNAVSGATSYKIYTATSASGTYTLAGTASSSPKEQFYYNADTSYWKVSAVNSAGESSMSSYASAPGWQQ